LTSKVQVDAVRLPPLTPVYRNAFPSPLWPFEQSGSPTRRSLRLPPSPVTFSTFPAFARNDPYPAEQLTPVPLLVPVFEPAAVWSSPEWSLFALKTVTTPPLAPLRSLPTARQSPLLSTRLLQLARDQPKLV
jgi:hypothetical protein